MRTLARVVALALSVALCLLLLTWAWPGKYLTGVAQQPSGLSSFIAGKPKATFFSLVRNSELSGILRTMHDIEFAFNDSPGRHYPYVRVSFGLTRYS